MPSYKVTYFNAKGRAETTRLALTVAGVDFEDERLTGDEWKERKADTPQGALPVLTCPDGSQIPQSGAMLRYVGREFSLYGKGNPEQTKVDVILETAEDLIKQLIKVMYEKDEEQKKTLQTAFNEEVAPKYANIFNKILQSEGNGWMVGGKLTIADLAVFTLLDNMSEGIFKDAFMKVFKKKLGKYYDKVKEEPRVKKWLEKRPKETKS